MHSWATDFQKKVHVNSESKQNCNMSDAYKIVRVEFSALKKAPTKQTTKQTKNLKTSKQKNEAKT